MNLHLQPKQFLFLYNCLRKFEKELLFEEDTDTYDSTKNLFEDFILGTLESAETKALATGFDKWVKSETNKIQGLEEELKKIKEGVSQEVLVEKLKPLKKKVNLKPGRPKKKNL